jgi:adenine-specific DNA-methyltransferase
LANDKIIFGDDESKLIELKSYISDFKEKLSSVIDIDNRSGAYDVRALFPEVRTAFENPKPVKFLNSFFPFLLKEGDIMLDFFAGSCSSGDAIFQLAKRDGVNRHFVLVQLPEILDEKSDAYKEGYRTISSISMERLRRASAAVRSEIAGGLDFGQHGDLDLGFKVLKLNQSNFKLWQAPVKDISDEELLQQMELNVDHIDPNASQEDLLYELLIKAGVMPTEKVEQIELAGHKLFSVAEGSLLVHLEDDIDQALIDAVLAKAPGQFICLDKAFHGNDQLKTNAVKTFEAFNQGREKIDQIDFKTV